MAGYIDLPEDFNSSDVEVDPRHDPYENAGFSTIQQMKLNRVEDRIASKKDWKSLTHTLSSPSSQYAMRIWTNAWDESWESLSLSGDVLPSAEHIIRFLSNAMRRMTPRYREKYGNRLSARTIGNGVMWLYKHLKFKHEKWEETKFIHEKVASFINKAVEDGKLFKGRKMERRWVGFALCQRLLQEFVGFALQHGCLSWDVIISQSLSIALMTALDCRGGDILRAKRTTKDQVLKFSAIKLCLEGGATIDHLLAYCTIEYEKGKKNSVNENRSRLLSPLGVPSYNCADPILLLVIHALRNGLFLEGSNIGTVLHEANRRQDKTIQWKYPDRPVIPQISYGKLIWTEPAPQSQLRGTVRQMGLAAGLLQPLNPHDIRRGAVRDLGRMPKNIFTVVHSAVGKAAGHARGSIDNGTTSLYAGDELNLLNKHKAKLPTKSSDLIGYTFTAPAAKKPRLSKAEIDTALRKAEEEQVSSLKEPQDPRNDRTVRKAIGEKLRKQKLKDWRAQSDPAAPPEASLAMPSPIVADPHKRKSPKDSESLPGVSLESTAEDFLDSEVSQHEQDSMLQNLLPNVEANDEDMGSQADSEDSTLVDVATAISLEGTSASKSPDGETSPLVRDSNAFVQFFSTYHVVRNTNLKGGWDPSDQEWQLSVDFGHARDHPTRFQYSCPNRGAGCQQICYTETLMKKHATSCDYDPSRVAEYLSDKKVAERERMKGIQDAMHEKAKAKWQCDFPKCGRGFTCEESLEVHKIDHAVADQKICPKSTECGVTQELGNRQLREHYEGFHTPLSMPARRCAYEGCTKTEEFTSMRRMKNHIRNAHGVKGKDLKELVVRKKA